MYKTFLNTLTQTARTAPQPQYEEPQQPEAPPPVIQSQADKPPTAPKTPRNKHNKTGLSVGAYYAAKDDGGRRRNHTLFQLGAVHSRQITKETGIIALTLQRRQDGFSAWNTAELRIYAQGRGEGVAGARPGAETGASGRLQS